MTSREVIRAIVKDKECPERMGIMESFWPDLRSFWEKEGLPPRESLLDFLNLDIHPIGEEWVDTDASPGVRKRVEEDQATYVEEDGWGARRRYWKDKSGTPEHVSFSLTSEAVWREKYRDRFLSFDIKRFGDMERRKSEYRRLAATDRFRVYELMHIYEIMRRSMGDVVMLEAMCLSPGWITDFCTVITDSLIRNLQYEIEEIGLPDGIWFYEDLAYGELPFTSPRMYRELILPHHRRFVDFCHGYDLPVIMHSCGNIERLFPEILDTGIDCIQPMEAKTGLNVISLAESARRRIAYMGNLDIRAFETNDRAQLEAEIVPKLEAIQKKRIPYVFHSDHSIPGSVRLATYLQAQDVFRQYGRY